MNENLFAVIKLHWEGVPVIIIAVCCIFLYFNHKSVEILILCIGLNLLALSKILFFSIPLIRIQKDEMGNAIGADSLLVPYIDFFSNIGIIWVTCAFAWIVMGEYYDKYIIKRER